MYIKTVRSLEDLDQATTFDDLASFGLTAPDQRNHRSGTNLILLALKSTPVLKGDWFKAIALLGTEMIDVDLNTRLAYKSLFETGWGEKLDDIANPAVAHNAFLLLGEAPIHRASSEFKLPAHRSIIARRETAILAAAETLRQRYTYDSDGRYGRDYRADRAHAANLSLRSSLDYGLTVFDELRAAGISDRTLRAALGSAAASLLHDGVEFDDVKVMGSIGQVVSHADALRSTFLQLAALEAQRTPGELLPELCGQLSKRDLLPQMDALLHSPSAAAHDAVLKLVREDLQRSEDKSADK